MAEIPNSQPSSPAAGNVTKPASEKPLEILGLSPEPWLINGKAQLGVTDFYRIDSFSVDGPIGIDMLRKRCRYDRNRLRQAAPCR